MAAGELHAVDIRSLCVRYGSFVAVDGLDLVAEGGEVVALLGPNGAGKTSTVEVAEGYRRPAGGTVRVLGYDPAANKRSLSPLVGIMLQRGGVYPAMGPREALALFASYYPSPDRPERLLELLGLARVARAPWRRLSGGEQQRLSLALALIGRPRVAFLDEPTAGVDPEGRLVMRSVISELRDSGACVLVTTHELEEAERLADRLFVIDQGRLVASGTLDELAARAGGEEVRWATSAGVDTLSLQRRLGVAVSEEEPGHYVAAAAGEPATVAAIAGWLAEQGLPLDRLRSGRAPLEDIYLRLTNLTRQGGPSSPAPGPRDAAAAREGRVDLSASDEADGAARR
ncbi:MAG: ABC transporter ATP-binding protein [Acidimicrobiales bacterium]